MQPGFLPGSSISHIGTADVGVTAGVLVGVGVEGSVSSPIHRKRCCEQTLGNLMT